MITVRFFHHLSRTPIAELQGVDSNSNLATLRAKVEQHLAAEEACMMRVFARWHIEIKLGERTVMVELTAQDEGSSLASLGIEDYSEVLLEGPLTDTVEGVGQAVALVGAQVRELKAQNADIKGILLRIAEGISGMSVGISELVAGQRRNDYISALPSIESSARLVLIAEEGRALGPLSLQKAAVTGYLTIAREEIQTRGELIDAARRFIIDPTTPRAHVWLEDLHTAVKTTDSGHAITLRASQPLSSGNHRWAVKIHEVGSVSIQLGLLPKLSDDMEAMMGSTSISKLGGWCIQQQGSVSFVYGEWQCDLLPFNHGDIVLFDYNFSNKTLTIRCGDKQVVGRISKAGEVLYPAFTFGYVSAKLSFESYQQ